MTMTVRIKKDLLKRIRESRGIPSEEIQARMIGVDRVTLRRIDSGGTPSAGFMAGVYEAFGLGLGEAFDIIPVSAVSETADVREPVPA